MRDKVKEAKLFSNTTTVYGPVKSWRFGISLGIDPIFKTSTCSFNCVYCQLGHIQNITNQLQIYVPTSQIVEDFKSQILNQPKIDVITYSGSGEPTLAQNLGEIADKLKSLRPKSEQIILTNATELYRQEVRENVKKLDRIIVKIDAPNEELFQLVNRPTSGTTLKRCLEGILKLKEEYEGVLEVQTMFMPINKKELSQLAEILKKISPDIVQLNTPKRPYPLEWHRENRGNHKLIFDYKTRNLKTLSKNEAWEVENQLAELTKLPILSIYQREPKPTTT